MVSYKQSLLLMASFFSHPRAKSIGLTYYNKLFEHVADSIRKG